MARQKSTFISGKMGNIIFYKRNGNYFARMAPDKVKQTAPTKKRSSNFGIASSAGKTLRKLLLPSLPFPKDKKMQNDFMGAIAKWLRLNNMKDLKAATRLPFLTNFNFNEKTGIGERWKVSINVTQPAANRIEIDIPAYAPAKKIIAPAHTTGIICSLTAASCRLKDGFALGSFTKTINIPYNNDLVSASKLSMPVPTTKGALIIVAASFTYILSGRKMNNKIAFMPSSVIDARYC